MLKQMLDPQHWCIVRTVRASGGDWSEGVRGLPRALERACRFIDELDARSVTVFDGQPSDGARVVARIDLDGLSPPAPALAEQLGQLIEAAGRLAHVATWDDEFTEQPEFDAAFNPLVALLDKLRPDWRTSLNPTPES